MNTEPQTQFSPERDLRVLVGMASALFIQLTGQAASIEDVILETMEPESPEYSGRMEVRGALQGWVSMGLSRGLLTRLLHLIGESRRDEEVLLDLTGELANTLISHARSHFGSRMHLLPPQTACGAWAGGFVGRPGVLCIVPFTWEQERGRILIALNASVS